MKNPSIVQVRWFDGIYPDCKVGEDIFVTAGDVEFQQTDVFKKFAATFAKGKSEAGVMFLIHENNTYKIVKYQRDCFDFFVEYSQNIMQCGGWYDILKLTYTLEKGELGLIFDAIKRYVKTTYYKWRYKIA